MSTVVVVNNSRAMRNIIARVLRQIGFRDSDIIKEENGQMVLDGIRRFLYKPNIIITDWQLSDMGAIELLEALQHNGFQIPLGIIVATSTKEMVDQASEAGALFLFGHPLITEDLEQCLAAYL